MHLLLSDIFSNLRSTVMDFKTKFQSKGDHLCQAGWLNSSPLNCLQPPIPSPDGALITAHTAVAPSTVPG